MGHSPGIVASTIAGLALLCTPVLSAQPSQPHAITIVVTNTNDSGPGSLRQALADVNDGDAIQFDPSLNGQSIMLTSGELAVNNSITITGPGDNLLAVSRPFDTGDYRIFHVTSGHTVNLEGLTISNGRFYGSASGSAIAIQNANLTITACTISGNYLEQLGGTIAFLNNDISFNLNIVRSRVINNRGGGIYNYRGILTITDSTISGNFNDYGGAIYGGAMITNSTISGNTASSAGGIYADGPLTISNSTLSGNSTFIQGGRGGAIWLNYPPGATITNCTFSGNTATDGGGIYLSSGLTMSNT